MNVDFVDWCSFVLNTCIKTGNTFNIIEPILAETLANELKVNNPNSQASFYGDRTYYHGMLSAVEELKKVGLMANDGERTFLWNITNAGRDYAADMVPLWSQICQEKLEVEYEQFLRVVNRLSHKTAPDHAWLERVSYQTFLAELAGSDIIPRLWSIARGLKQWGFVSGTFTMDGEFDLLSTYKGLVWETRRSLTRESKFIDDLVKDWETTSVEFKSDVSTDTDGQKAEFIRDILSLATTKASGQRWLIIGFDDNTHEYWGPPNPKLTPNHIEQLLHEYTIPMVQIQYRVVDYREEPVGKLEVFRDAKHLPYKVRKSLGSQRDKRRITEGDIYVRHGSQVQPPTKEELQALQEEGDQARLNR
jgi:hypothetical protein